LYIAGGVPSIPSRSKIQQDRANIFGEFMKPHVICHMVSSVDGRTLNGRWRPDGKLASAHIVGYSRNFRAPAQRSRKTDRAISRGDCLNAVQTASIL
jgi:hypothetical protein